MAGAIDRAKAENKMLVQIYKKRVGYEENTKILVLAC